MRVRDWREQNGQRYVAGSLSNQAPSAARALQQNDAEGVAWPLVWTTRKLTKHSIFLKTWLLTNCSEGQREN